MIPYRIETLFQHEPWANRALCAATVATSLALEWGAVPPEVARQYFVWGEGSPVALLGYLFAHGGILHLAGNMMFLWVFGDAVCATVGNLAYLGLYLALGALAGLVHQLAGGGPVVGASGAIAGVVGLAVAFYPTNRVNVFYWLGLAPRTGRLWLWALALYWTAWDVLGAAFHLGPVAYWAHLGGTFAGVGAGLLLLATGRVQLTEFDHRSLLDALLRRAAPHHVPAGADQARAELQRAARAFLASQTAPAAVATARPEPRRIQLRSHATPPAAAQSSAAAGAMTRTEPVHFGASHAADPSGPQKARAWPTELPDVRYFYFDGYTRFGPLSRTEFLGRLNHTFNTTRWWYWAEGMATWRRVTELEATAGAPAEKDTLAAR